MAILSDPQDQRHRTSTSGNGMSALFAHADADTEAQQNSPHWIDAMGVPSGGFAAGLNAHQPARQWPGATDTNNEGNDAIYQRGFAAGRDAARQEMEAREQALRDLHLRFGELDSAALEAMEQALSDTVIALCTQVLGHNATLPDQFTQRCRDAARKLGHSAGDCALHLHPEDVQLVGADCAGQWRIVEDTAMERGSLRFESENGSVGDGPAEWREAIAEAIGLNP